MNFAQIRSKVLFCLSPEHDFIIRGFELMDKKHFILKLIPPRPSFFYDITAEEHEIMRQHSEYWRERMRQGLVLVFGPVMDPDAPYGMGILEVENDGQIAQFIASDPASAIATYEIIEMKAITPAMLTEQQL